MSGVIFLLLRILLALSLYVFLGISLITIWRDLKSQIDLLERNARVPSIGIRIHKDLVSQSYDYQRHEINIGRHPASDLVLDSERVSANHARLFYFQKQWWIEDLDSTNGSLINNESIISPTVVVDGDEIQCGDINLLLRINKISPTPA